MSNDTLALRTFHAYGDDEEILRENGIGHLIVEARIVDLVPGQQDPYFSLTHEAYADGNLHGWSIGATKPAYIALFPELSPASRWHLASSSGPMHYIANSMYWLGHRGWVDGRRDSPPNDEYAASTMVYGRLPGDAYVSIRDLRASEDFAFKFLTARLPDLREAMFADLRGVFGELPELFITGYGKE